jgi:hypothetical protein
LQRLKRDTESGRAAGDTGVTPVSAKSGLESAVTQPVIKGRTFAWKILTVAILGLILAQEVFIGVLMMERN